MPELPEVETIKRGLEKHILGKRILNIRVFEPVIVSGRGALRKRSKKQAESFIAGLSGETIKGIERSGKNLIFRMKSGKAVLSHLKMTGQFVYRPSRESGSGGLPHKHTRLHFKLSGGDLYYNDVRKFGYVLYVPSSDLLAKELARNGGAEPLASDFTPEKFLALLAGRRGILKNIFLGQTIVAGLGNIYSDEVCFLAGIRPSRRVETLHAPESRRLHQAIITVLASAVSSGGSSISDYVLADGTRGSYAKKHTVYGRGGLPCFQCKNPLAKKKIAGRTSVFCFSCQI